MAIFGGSPATPGSAMAGAPGDPGPVPARTGAGVEADPSEMPGCGISELVSRICESNYAATVSRVFLYVRSRLYKPEHNLKNIDVWSHQL